MTGTRNPFITAAKTSILAGFALLFVLGGSARGAEVHLAWDANSESDLAGYVIHYGTESGKYSVSHDVGNVTDYRVNNLTEGQTYYFAATAYDSSQNHSSYSQELTYQVPTTDTDGDGLSDGSETDVYQTDPTNPDTDGDGLSDGAEVSSHGTDPTAADSDGDGLDDRTEIEIFFSDPLNADTDGDGLNDGTEAEVHGTDPTVADSDKDGLWDGAEIQTYNTDPLDSDSDQDGYTDGYEVSNGMDPTTHQENRSPHQPLLAAPADGTQDVELTPTLETEAFSDPDAGDYHRQTQWQVSAESDFSMPVFDLTSDRYLTGLQLPEALLDTGRTYYWRVRFFDRVLEPSPWSNARWFATVSVLATDLNQNGIPDSQEVDSTSDLDGDQTPDIQQVNMKTVRVVTGDERIAIKGSPNVTAIETLISISDGTIAEQYAKPASMPLGMICFRFHVAQYGDTATIDIFFSDPAPEDSQWYKYDLHSGWQDYSAHAVFSPNRKKLTLELTDGGIGDGDGVVNGVILDPSGLGSDTRSVGIDGLDARLQEVFGGCFIGAAGKPGSSELALPPLYRYGCAVFASGVVMVVLGLIFQALRRKAERCDEEAAEPQWLQFIDTRDDTCAGRFLIFTQPRSMSSPR